MVLDHFESRVFSNETLVAGADMVEQGLGMASPDLQSQEIMDEIRKMQDELMLNCFETQHF